MGGGELGVTKAPSEGGAASNPPPEAAPQA